jgi:hypothetical protein
MTNLKVLSAFFTGTRFPKRGRPKPSLHGKPFRPQIEHLENRVTPSLLGAFELDGNVTSGVLGPSGSTTTSHDWDQVFAEAGSPVTGGSFIQGAVSGALAGSFVTDKVNTNTDDIFTGGSSKDTQGIQQGPWLFTGSKPQGKDDISHAYAAAYIDPSNGHLIFFAGMDRFDNSGDSTAGFWLFQNPIGQNPNVTQNGGHPFTGTHTNGDIFLVSDFTIGGSVSTIAVYQWIGDDSTGHLENVTALGNPNTFAIVNSAPISVPWSFTNKSGQTIPASGEFLEEGVDLTALGLQGCFSTFLAETRSSQSPTATLSDLVIGNFPLCSLAAPQFTGLSKVGDLVTYPLTVQNTGAMPLFIQSVSDTLLGDIVVNHSLQTPVAPATSISSAFNFTQPLSPGARLTIFVTRPVQATDSDPTASTVTFIGTDDLAGTDNPITASATNSVNLFQPSASMTETASPSSTSNPGQVITYTFTVSNTSSADSPNLVLDLSNPNDSFTGTLLGNLEADAIHAAAGNNTATVASIAPGTSFTFTETRAIQPSDLTPLTDTSNVAFTLAQNLGNFIDVIPASASASVTLVPTIAAPGFISGLVAVGHPVTYALKVTNTGPINVYVQNVSESLLGAIVVNGVVQAPVAPVTSIDASSLGNGLLAPGQSVTIFVTRTVQPGDPTPNDSTVRFTVNTTADFGGDQVTAQAMDRVNAATFAGFLDFLTSTGGVSNPGIANALAAKATNAVADFDAGHFSAAKGILGAFINQVHAQRGKFITDAAADLLLEYASLLLDQLP